MSAAEIPRETRRDDAPPGRTLNLATADPKSAGAGRSLRAGAPAWIWIGIGIAASGFVLIAVAWGQVAGETEVYRQLPYVVSAGFFGLGLVLVGLTIVNVVARQRDGVERHAEIARLMTIMEELGDILGSEKDR